MSRLEWVLKKAGIEELVFTGIVTNGGVASTVRDAHVRDFHATVLEDGCAAFSSKSTMSIDALRPVASVMTCADFLADWNVRDGDPAETKPFDLSVPVLVIGGGAWGLVAALAAQDAGAEMLVVRMPCLRVDRPVFRLHSRRAGPAGKRHSTSPTTSPIMGSDIMAKAKGEPDPGTGRSGVHRVRPDARMACGQPRPAVHPARRFLYPGHSVHRMHAHPDKTGAALGAAAGCG